MSEDNMHDFGSEHSETFVEDCSNCGKTHHVSTQQDSNPEYYTEVYIKCTCGESVRFLLPVN